MILSTEDLQIRNTISALVEIITSNTALRENPVRSSFVVSPEQHRKLELVCKLTSKTRQDHFSKALDHWLDQQLYLDELQ